MPRFGLGLAVLLGGCSSFMPQAGSRPETAELAIPTAAVRRGMVLDGVVVRLRGPTDGPGPTQGVIYLDPTELRRGMSPR